MSASASLESVDPASTIAETIDYDLQDVADHIPVQIKFETAGREICFYELSDVGCLIGAYIGNYTIRITALVDGYDGDVGVTKDFALRDHYQQLGGMPHEVEPTTADAIQDCPISLSKLGQIISELRDGFIQRVERDEQYDPTSVYAARGKQALLAHLVWRDHSDTSSDY